MLSQSTYLHFQKEVTGIGQWYFSKNEYVFEIFCSYLGSFSVACKARLCCGGLCAPVTNLGEMAQLDK